MSLYRKVATENQIFYPQDIHEVYASLSSRHWWFKSRSQLINHVLRSRVRSTTEQNSFHYLEAGCGTGFVLYNVQAENPNWVCLGIEGQQEAVILLKKQYPSLAVKTQNLKHFSPSSLFHCIGCFDVLEHIEDDLCMLERFCSFLYPGGSLLLTVPQHSWLWSHADKFAGHKRRYKSHDLLQRLRTAGFSINYSSSFVFFLLPFMFFQRVCAGKYCKQYNPHSELKIHFLINIMLYWVMSFERFLMKFGVSFPIGGSLIVLAEKK